MMDKRKARLRRATSFRKRNLAIGALRLSVFRSSCHIYAQIFSPDGSTTLVSACSLEAVARAGGAYTGNRTSAEEVGKLLGERALSKGIKSVAFDRSGYLYHGRVKALADGARKAGLAF